MASIGFFIPCAFTATHHRLQRRYAPLQHVMKFNMSRYKPLGLFTHFSNIIPSNPQLSSPTETHILHPLTPVFTSASHPHTPQLLTNQYPKQSPIISRGMTTDRRGS